MNPVTESSSCLYAANFAIAIDLINTIELDDFFGSNHGKTKSARIQKRNVFSTDKNEM